jgi:hypothetical protein
VVPGAIPSVVGITLASDQAFVAWLLGAAEIRMAALCIGALRTPEPAALHLTVLTLLVFHAASAVADTMALAQAWSLPIVLNLALRVVMASSSPSSASAGSEAAVGNPLPRDGEASHLPDLPRNPLALPALPCDNAQGGISWPIVSSSKPT